ncbi:hypothetical protein K438DRAFT_1985380 [Mycena galopus ATCC 62051]|nr:hypothetical protein K438DRAFT_1985380 [Mycena galopus ATCC 62051]
MRVLVHALSLCFPLSRVSRARPPFLYDTAYTFLRPAPGHQDLATQALATCRARPISMSIWFFGDCFLHTPARNARPPRAFPTSPPPAVLDGNPKGYCAVTVRTANPITN